MFVNSSNQIFNRNRCRRCNYLLHTDSERTYGIHVNCIEMEKRTNAYERTDDDYLDKVLTWSQDYFDNT